MTPCVPRPCSGYSSTNVRLPKPCSVAVSDRALRVDDDQAMTSSPGPRAACRARRSPCGPSSARRPRRSEWPCRRREQHDVARAVGDATSTSASPSSRPIAILPAARLRELGERRLLDGAVARREEHVLVVGELAHRLHGVDALVFLERQQVHDRLAARTAARIRQLVHLEPEHAGRARERQQRVVRVRDPELLDEILFLHRGRRSAAAAAALRAIRC